MKKILSESFQILIGILLASVGLKAFLLPNGFLDGGATGIAILLSELTGFDISFLLIGVSTPFLVLAWFSLSRNVFWKSLGSIALLAVMIHFENFTPITDDKLLIAIFGGLFLGAGIGVSVKNGAVLDGSEILGIYINDRYGISIGKIILVFNVILFSITSLLLSVEVAMYSILTFLITAKVIDLMIEGFEDHVGLMIMTNRSEEIETMLSKEIGTGLTVYPSVEGYGRSGNQKELSVVQTVVNRIDIKKTYNVIDSIDPRAFIIEFHVNDIKGGVQRKYLTAKQLKTLQPKWMKGSNLPS